MLFTPSTGESVRPRSSSARLSRPPGRCRDHHPTLTITSASTERAIRASVIVVVVMRSKQVYAAPLTRSHPGAFDQLLSHSLNRCCCSRVRLWHTHGFRVLPPTTHHRPVSCRGVWERRQETDGGRVAHERSRPPEPTPRVIRRGPASSITYPRRWRNPPE